MSSEGQLISSYFLPRGAVQICFQTTCTTLTQALYFSKIKLKPSLFISLCHRAPRQPRAALLCVCPRGGGCQGGVGGGGAGHAAAAAQGTVRVWLIYCTHKAHQA